MTYDGVSGAISFDDIGDAIRDTAFIKTSTPRRRLGASRPWQTGRLSGSHKTQPSAVTGGGSSGPASYCTMPAAGEAAPHRARRLRGGRRETACLPRKKEQIGRNPDGILISRSCSSGISVGGQYALIAIGYTMVYGILRLINFAHGDVFMVAGLMMVYFSPHACRCIWRSR